MNPMAGTAVLVRLALRRDRVLIPAWTTAFVLLAVTSSAATKGLFPTTESLAQAAAGMNATPAMVAVYGRIHDPTSLGALAMLKAMGTGAVLLAVFAILLVIRHTRAEEESGRLELLGSGVVGRLAPPASALIVACGTNVALGLVTAVGLAFTGLPVAGSFAFGSSWAGVGITFAAIAALTAQSVRGARAATGLALAVLGVVFLFRAVGDTAGPAWLSWLSPIGWGQQLRPYAGDRWWVLAVVVAFAAGAIAVAFRLCAGRDLNAGVLPERPGPAHAKFHGPFGLAWRLQRGTLIGWAVGFTGYGLMVGSIASTIGDLIDTPQAREAFARLGGDKALADTVLAAMFTVLGVLASAYGVQAAHRLRTEETIGRLDPLLSTRLSRTRWAASHLVIAFAGTALLLTCAGLATGIVHATRVGDPAQVTRVLAAALVQIPAAWTLIGIVVLAYGLAPRLTAFGWVVLAGFLLLGELGPLIDLDPRLLDLSPFTHTPKRPAAAADLPPLLWLVAVTTALVTAGLAAFRHRDITT